jgi:hypothetical protein
MLANAGVAVGHERMGPHGTVSSYFAVDDTYYHGPHADQRDRLSDYAFEHVWMLVRNPLQVIASLHQGSPHATWWDWQERHTGIRRDRMDSLEACTRYVLRWDALCHERQPTKVFRIEDWKSQWSNIAGILEIPEDPLPDFSVANAKGERQELTLQEIERVSPELRDGVAKLSAKYGYG